MTNLNFDSLVETLNILVKTEMETLELSQLVEELTGKDTTETSCKIQGLNSVCYDKIDIVGAEGIITTTIGSINCTLLGDDIDNASAYAYKLYQYALQASDEERDDELAYYHLGVATAWRIVWANLESWVG